MNLVLYKYNLNSLFRDTPIEDIKFFMFPGDIRKSMWLANTVTYKDGRFSKILKNKEVINPCLEITPPSIMPRTLNATKNSITIDLRNAKSITINYE